MAENGNVLDMLVYEPVEFVKKNQAYLEEKYNKDFGIKTAITNTIQLENIVTAYCKDNEEKLFKVKCKCCSDGNYHFIDNYMNLVICEAAGKKLKNLAEEKVGGTKKVYLQGWTSSEYGDKDANTDLSEEELIKLAGKHCGIWHIFIEYGGSAEEFADVKNDIVKSIQEAELYGTYYIYGVAENALLLMDEENFMDYLPQKRAADGKICISFSKDAIRKEA